MNLPISSGNFPFTRRNFVRAAQCFALASVCLLVAPVHAQGTYPNKPIRLLVGFSVGSGNDVLARELARELMPILGQPVVVENRLGAGGTIATDAVAKAAPDGYVLGLGTSSQLVMNIGFYKKLPFNVDKDLSMIALLAKTNMVLEVGGQGPKTLAEFIERAKAKPNSMTYGSGGYGSITHIVAEAFAQRTGLQLRHVPYKGGGAVLIDLAGGHVDMGFDGLNNGAALAAEGKIRLLAISGAKRNPLRPDVPTFDEAGVDGYDAYTWNGIFGPANLPPSVAQKLNAAFSAAMTTASVKAFVERNAGDIFPPATPAQADAFAKAERDRWIPFLHSRKIVEQ